MADFFSSPFIAMPRREIADRNNWLGYTSTSRGRPLDSMPFRRALRHEMEIWHWENCKVDYAILRFTVNGQAAAKDVDFYHPEPMLAEPVELGTFQAQDGKLLLRAEVIGANAASRGPRFYCGFDCVELR